MVSYSHLVQNIPQFIVIPTVDGFGVVNKAEIDVFLELSCFYDDIADIGNLISGSSAFSKISLNIWTFSVWSKELLQSFGDKATPGFADKGSSSPSHGFSSSEIWMWELGHKEGWVPKNWCLWTVVLKKSLKSPLEY